MELGILLEGDKNPASSLHVFLFVRTPCFFCWVCLYVQYPLGVVEKKIPLELSWACNNWVVRVSINSNTCFCWNN